MAKIASVWLGGVTAIALMVTALWAWNLPPELGVQSFDQPYLAKLGIRSLAIALGVGAQVILFVLVVTRIYPAKLLDRVLGIGLGVMSFAALGTAIVLALASR